MVVLGVLIALAVDDYRVERHDRQLEIDYVQRLRVDLERNLQYISEVWYPGLARKRQALDAIAPVVRGQQAAPDEPHSFLVSVARGGAMGTTANTWVTDTTFKDLIATGNLRLIQDPAVRAAIADYYEGILAETRRVEERFTGYVPFVHSVIPAELRDGLDAAALERFGVDRAMDRVLSEEFRAILNQEYNLLLFMEDRRYEDWTRQLDDTLAAYLTTLRTD